MPSGNPGIAGGFATVAETGGAAYLVDSVHVKILDSRYPGICVPSMQLFANCPGSRSWSLWAILLPAHMLSNQNKQQKLDKFDQLLGHHLVIIHNGYYIKTNAKNKRKLFSGLESSNQFNYCWFWKNERFKSYYYACSLSVGHQFLALINKLVLMGSRGLFAKLIIVQSKARIRHLRQGHLNRYFAFVLSLLCQTFVFQHSKFSAAFIIVIFKVGLF
jgi:hypothetical protein